MASRITTYNTLVSAILEAAEDVGTELRDFLPVVIDNAENRLAREIDTLDVIYSSTIVVSPSTATVTKPAGLKLINHLNIIDGVTRKRTVLKKKTDDYLDEYWPVITSVGTPKYYADIDRNTIRIAPCVSTSTSVEITGVKRPTVLSSANTTNVFTSSVPDALFHACMIEVAIWQRNDSLLQAHTQMYISARDNINNEGRRQRRDDGSKPMIDGQNTLLDGGK